MITKEQVFEIIRKEKADANKSLPKDGVPLKLINLVLSLVEVQVLNLEETEVRR